MKYFELIRKILFIFSFLMLMPQISQAAITDCSQLSSDGQRDCISPTVTYTGSFGGRYSSLDEIIQAYKEIQCNILPGFSQCTLKTTASYKTPSTCTQKND